MTVQTKKLIGDTGSAIVAEVVNQLNRAMVYSNSENETLAAAGGTDNFPLMIFKEDAYLEDFQFLSGGAFDDNGDTIAIILDADSDLTSGTVVISVADFDPNSTTADTLTSLKTLLDSGDHTNVGSLPYRVSAGSRLSLRITTGGGSTAGGTDVTVGLSYRPIKDELVLEPNGIPNKLRNWSVRDR